MASPPGETAIGLSAADPPVRPKIDPLRRGNVMRNSDSVPASPRRSHRATWAVGLEPGDGSGRSSLHPQADTPVIMTEVSPFHCLYSDALDFHSQSRQMMAKSVGSASRLARASILLYIEAVESLIHQAAVELGRPDLAPLVATRPAPSRWPTPGNSCRQSSPTARSPRTLKRPPGPSSPRC